MSATAANTGGQDLVQPPPEHCPGTQSEQAGKSQACEGCPNQSICSTAPKGPDPGIFFHFQLTKITNYFEKKKNI